MVPTIGNGHDFEVLLTVTSIRFRATREQLFLSPELLRILVDLVFVHFCTGILVHEIYFYVFDSPLLV
jgi:hypothetical protein